MSVFSLASYKIIKHVIITKLQMTRTWNKSDILLAVQFVRQNPNLNLTKITRIYKVPPKTLSRRVYGINPRSNIPSNLRKLTDLEEEAIVRYILDLDSRAFPPRRSTIEDIANRLLTKRDGGHVRKC
jgi:hypothetical protein